MTSSGKPEKILDLLEKINRCIARGQYILTLHALDRQNKRCISLPETLHVLRTGCEEKRKTSFDEKHNTWKYAIKGKTLRDKLNVRVIVAFDKDGMVIITVINLGEK